MIMVLSDGGVGTRETVKYLETKNVKYVMYFTDFMKAAHFGKGNVIVDTADRRTIAATCVKNKVTAIIDTTSGADKHLSETAYSACGDKIRYVKLVKLKKYGGVTVQLSYSKLAKKIGKTEGRTVMFASAQTVAGVSEKIEKSVVGEKVIVPREKREVFDVKGALSYEIPITNVIETDDAIEEILKRYGAKLVVCDESREISDVVNACQRLEIPIYLTHGCGIDFKYVATSTEDALYYATDADMKG